MNWKNWLYIPKGDKRAIACLLVVIIILSGINYYISKKKQADNKASIEINEAEDYKQWKSQLTEQKEEEQKSNYEEYKKSTPYYQPKIQTGETIELNTADTTALKTIPGIASGFAYRIVNYREALEGFASIEQLNEVWGIDAYLFSQIAPYFTLETGHNYLYINKDSFDKLLKHPYLDYKQVEVITDIRSRKGAIKSTKRLLLLDEFSNRDIDKLKPYLNFSE